MPNMRTACNSVFSGELTRTGKGKSVGLKVLESHPEYIGNVFNWFIDHIQLGTGLFVEFHNNFQFVDAEIL